MTQPDDYDDTRLLDALADWAIEPQPSQALTWRLGVDTVLFGLEGFTPRTQLNIAAQTVIESEHVDDDAKRRITNLISELWPDTDDEP